jgi:protein-tyrosine phosphatase
MKPELHWIKGPWPGKLAIAARPRGNDWLDDEVEAWKSTGIDTVVSFLTPDEEKELGLEREAEAWRARALDFLAFPIEDRSVPSDPGEVAALIRELEKRLARGRAVALHCRQGLGRSALVASCLLVSAGLEPDAAFKRVGQARGCAVPETTAQREWVVRFARDLAPEAAPR